MKKQVTRLLAVCMAAALLLPAVPAQAWVSDNGNGTYSNPAMWGDYPDNDIIRVDDTFYMMSTSMHLFPGCPVMSSKDLVNWSYESYALPYGDPDEPHSGILAIADEEQRLDLKNGTAYGLGSWATSLQYSERLKKFYMLTNIQDGSPEYAALSVADSAAGPWSVYRLDNPEGKIKGLYDPGLFFDKDPVTGQENGKIYVIHGQGELFVTELEVVDATTGELKIVDDTPGAVRNKPLYHYTGGSYNEGSRGYKLGDTYYILSTPTWSAGSKKEICIQTKDLLNGPYAVREVMTSRMNFQNNGIHQGALVDIPVEYQNDGATETQWWSIIFQDRQPLGRVPTLQPVYWETDEDGLKWPMVGKQGKDGEQAVVTMEKPNVKLSAPVAPSKVADSDDFDNGTLGLHWQWNHIPDDSKWSLSERPGSMRLYTATVTSDLAKAQNTLRQRIVGPWSAAEIKLDITAMADGDMAGLAACYANASPGNTYIGVHKDGTDLALALTHGKTDLISADIPDETRDIWFRAEMPELEHRVEFSYSLDGQDFTRLGGRYDLLEGSYVGAGYGVFNFATKALGGHVDMDYFHMETPRADGNYHAAGKKIEAERYDDFKYELVPGKGYSYNDNPLTTSTSDYVYNPSLNTNPANDLAVSNLKDGDWLQYDRVDFGAGAEWVNLRVAGTEEGGTIEVRLAESDGPVLATVDVPNTGDREIYQNVFAPLSGAGLTGAQKIFLVYRGDQAKSCYINWFQLGGGQRPTVPAVPEGLAAKDLGGNVIRYTWDQVPGALTYDLRIGQRVISNATSPFDDTALAGGSVVKATVRAKNHGGYSDWSEGIKASTGGNPYVIPQGGMSISSFSSQEAGGEGSVSGYISAILDGDPDSFWHTKWGGGNAPPPHWFVLDLGQEYEIAQIGLLPRQGGGPPNGHIYKATLSYSTAGTADKDFLMLADYENTDDTGLQTVSFEPVTARYLKVDITESRNDFASLAEINVYRSQADTTPPSVPGELAVKISYPDEQPVATLTWSAAQDAESAISSYSVYRDDVFLDAVTGTSYADDDVAIGGLYRYQVLATNGAGLDSPMGEALEVTIAPPVKMYPIPQGRLTATASSEETVVDKGEYGYITNAIDGDIGTFWSVKWKDGDKADPPHWYQIDLGEDYSRYQVGRIDFTPRQDPGHGVVDRYSLSCSTDGETYMPLVTEGTWDLVADGLRPVQSVSFDPVNARYFKLDCLDSVWPDYVFAAMAEINVFSTAPMDYHTVTIIAPEGGTLTVKDGETVVNSGVQVDVDTVLTVTATPDETHTLKKITVNGEKLDGDTVMVTKDVTIAAEFEAAEPPHEHTMDPTPAKAATCTEAGNTAYWYCAGCKRYFSDAEGSTEIMLAETVIPPIPHDFGESWKSDEDGHWHECTLCHTARQDEAVHTPDREEATETDSVKCSECGYIIAPPVGHEHTPDTSEWLHDETQHWHKCTGCEEKQDAADHSGGIATCTEQAVCEVCDQAYGALAAHDTSEWDHGETQHWRKCALCGTVDEASRADHTWELISETETEKTYGCVCGAEKAESLTPPELDTVPIDEAVGSAQAAKTDVTVTEKPADQVRKGTKFVTQAVMDALDEAIQAAVAAKDAAETQDDIQAAADALNGATETFTAAIQTGTYSSSGSSGGGSSSNTTTKTAKNSDGSTTKTVTNKKTGTVTETTTWPNGDKTVVETKKDGTVTETVQRKDGLKSETVIDPAGETTAEITLPEQAEDTVILPLPPVTADKNEIGVKTEGPATIVIPVKAPTASTVAVIVHGDGREEIVKTSVLTEDGLTVDISGGVTVRVIDNAKTFADVDETHWAHEAVTFATSRELFNGTGEQAFDPSAPMSRAMLVTVLARMDGQDLTGGETWYAKAMTWGQEQGITDGAAPEASITRESLALMLWRYAGQPAAEGDGKTFPDSGSVSDWAVDAMDWAVRSGILSGKDGGLLDPAGSASRAEVATMLMRSLAR